MSEPVMTLAHVHILQHSLGLTDPYARGRSYRNHFVAGGKDEQLCRELVTMGLMEQGRTSELTGGDPCFHVTDIGKALASLKVSR